MERNGFDGPPHRFVLAASELATRLEGLLRKLKRCLSVVESLSRVMELLGGPARSVREKHH